MFLLKTYITMMPVILSGIANMLFTKTAIYKKYCRTCLDKNKNFVDNKRIFGDNKTCIGFISMILFSIIFFILWGVVCELFPIKHLNDLYNINNNSFQYNFVIGVVMGGAYMICELPNSFIKRRLNIPSGKTGVGIVGVIFYIIDQIDSMLGVMLMLYFASNITWIQYWGYVAIGGLTHIVVNLILFLLKVRKNI